MANRILIVEDEAITALDLKLTLEDYDYEVIDIVDNAEDAINTAAEESPDLTIMDINLKGEKSGIDAAKIIMEFNLPVIYLTANTDDVTFSEVLANAPSYAFIGKPFDKKTIKQNIEMAINRAKVDAEKVNLAHGFL